MWITSGKGDRELELWILDDPEAEDEYTVYHGERVHVATLPESMSPSEYRDFQDSDPDLFEEVRAAAWGAFEGDEEGRS